VTGKLFQKAIFLSVISIFLFTGCATAPVEFDPKISGAQVIVDPETVRLGIATLQGTPLQFRGKGFQPEDSVFITLEDVRIGNQVKDLAIADANVDKDGHFTAKVGVLAKMNEILRAQLGSNEKMETIVIVTGPPIPDGVYNAKAVSMESDITAKCKLKVCPPSFFDKFKDAIGESMGKIVKKN
jgi:hypothetical protein